MTIKIGTIQEITGDGYEILIDSETRSFVLAKFFNGHFVGTTDPHFCANTHGTADEKTVVTAG